MRTLTATAFFLVLLQLTMTGSAAQTVTIITPEDPAHPPIEIYVALVTTDLQVKPVPKHRLLLAGIDTDSFYEAVTSFEGRVTVRVAPGTYALSSVEPVAYEDSLYSWELRITVPADGLTLELSNDNATKELATTDTAVRVTDEGVLFQRAAAAVLTIMSEAGKGSGFLVTDSGLILTNHHVVADSEYLAVKLDELRKYPAVLVAQDARSDVAVLRVNSIVVDGIAPLTLADSSPDRSPVSVGERVLAIGSPLSSEGILTTGIVSKVEAGAIISDVNINPGNSGGPLISMLGEVVGINTFGVAQWGSGPGISGIVRIHKAYPVIEEARARLEDSAPPSSDRLPEASRHPYPPEALARLADPELRVSDYHIEAGKIDIQFVTPVVLASLEIRAESQARKQQDIRSRRSRRRNTQRDDTTEEPAQDGGTSPQVKDDFYEWRRYAGDYRAVVRITAIPEIKMTGGSFFAKAMLGANAPGRYRFKVDFLKMRLMRGGFEVAPIHPGKTRQVVRRNSGVDILEDIGTYGSYEYPPEAFEPSQRLLLEVYTEQRPNKPKVREIDYALQERIWKQFAPYFASLRGEAAGEQ